MGLQLMASQYSRALVTGGAGFIGSHIADRLIENNFEVRIIDDLSSGQMEHLRTFKNKKSVLFMKGDIRDPEIVKTAVKDADVVFHEAAIVGPAQSIENPLLTNDVNVNGTLRLLEASVKYGVKRFILASSAAIYGEQRVLPIKETAIPQPSSPYAISKLSAELYSISYYRAYGLETVILRYFNVYGERQANGPYASVITAFLNNFMCSKQPVIYGDGEQARDFVYVKDVVDANMLAMEKDCAGAIFNTASGSSVKINDLFKILQKTTGKNEIQPEYSAPKKCEIRESCGDISKAKSVLGFKPMVSIEEGLKKLAESWKHSK